MHKISIRFYEELNDFLPIEKQKKRFEHNYIDRTSVKDLIESLGVPHAEVDLILINGKSVGFDYLINDDDDISVYPVFESIDITDLQHLRPKPLRKPKFVADVHLGRLARYMRMLGFDTLYKNNIDDDEIVNISVDEKRTILTRDRNILKRSVVTHGYFVRNIKIKKQLIEILNRFNLENQIKEFTRCIECNTILEPISKEEIIDKLPLKVSESQGFFSICPGCKKIYWKGTHHHKMNAFIQSFKNSDY
jgi:uncharacterized protein